MISQERIAAAKNPSITVPVIGSLVPLKQLGSRWWGLCQFHEDSRPSMAVTPGRWRCFACNEGGDLIDFVRRYEGLSFPAAVDWILGRSGTGGIGRADHLDLHATTSTSTRLFLAARTIPPHEFYRTVSGSDCNSDATAEWVLADLGWATLRSRWDLIAEWETLSRKKLALYGTEKSC